jgi:plasmid stabilization system protein ParE
MDVVFRPEAEAELLEAPSWYAARSPGLGFELARAIDVAIASALRMPLAHPRIEGDLRRVSVRRFPYAVIYVPTPLQLVVVSCFHHRRRLRPWSP